jgi:hypothetical protein
MQKAYGLPSKVSCDILHQVVGPDTKGASHVWVRMMDYQKDSKTS